MKALTQPTKDTEGSGESPFEVIPLFVLVCEVWRPRELWHLHLCFCLAQARFMRRHSGGYAVPIGLGPNGRRRCHVAVCGIEGLIIAVEVSRIGSDEDWCAEGRAAVSRILPHVYRTLINTPDLEAGIL